MTIDRQMDNTDLVRKINHLMANENIKQKPALVSRLSTFKHTLKLLQRKGKGRYKRGAVDIVGRLGNYLFGIATEEQVTNLREQIKANEAKVGSLIQWTGKATSVMNVTRQYLRDLQHWTWEAVSRIQADEELHRHMSYLQQEVNEAVRHHDALSQAIRDLHHGQLTERILPKAAFSEISSTETWVSPLDWYYQECRVSPLWDNEHLAFVVVLPTVDDRQLIAYEFLAYPMLTNNSAVIINVPELLVSDTSTGIVEEPRECRGRSPRVCMRGIQQRGGCMEAIFRDKALSKCILTQAHVEPVYHIDDGTIVTLTHEDQMVTERCVGRTEVRTQVPSGTNLVTWQRGCVIEAAEFTIGSSALHHAALTTRLWQACPLQDEFPLKLPHIDALPAIIKVADLSLPTVLPQQPLLTPSQWGQSIVLLVIVLIVAVLIMCRKRIQQCKVLKCRHVNSKELEDVTPTPGQSVGDRLAAHFPNTPPELYPLNELSEIRVTNE